MIGAFASNTSIPWYSATGAVKQPSGPTGMTASMFSRSVTTLSSSPNAPAVCTRPEPSVVVTNSATTKRWAFSQPR